MRQLLSECSKTHPPLSFSDMLLLFFDMHERGSEEARELTARGPRTARALRLVVDVIWWLSLSAVAVGVALLVLLLTHRVGRGVLSMDLGFSLDGSRVHLRSNVSGLSSPSLQDASGAVSFAHPSASFVLLGAAVAAVAAGAWLTILHQLRRLVAALSTGDPFNSANAVRLRNIGAAVIGFELLGSVIVWIQSLYLRHVLVAHGLTVRPQFAVDVPAVLLGLLLLVIATAFRVGAEWRQERELTI